MGLGSYKRKEGKEKRRRGERIYRVGQKRAYITIITHKHFGKIEKNTSDQHCSEWSV